MHKETLFFAETRCCGMRRVELQRHINSVCATAFKMDNNHIIWMRSEYFALIMNAILIEDSRRNSVCKIKLTFITANRTTFVVLDIKITQRLVRLMLTSKPILTNNFLCFGIFARFHQREHFIERFWSDVHIFICK